MLVLDDTADASRMVPPASTRSSDRLNTIVAEPWLPQGGRGLEITEANIRRL